MNKDVIISISSIIESNQQNEKIETVSEGAFFKKDDCLYVLYDEEVSDGIINKCRIKIYTDKVEMRKSGAYTTVMTFTREGKTSSHYATPYGALDLEIETKKLDIVVDSKKIKVILSYSLSSNDIEMSHHDMNINICEK